MKKNKGYTLVEVIIVIAIIAILAGLALGSIGVIHQAKYNSAGNLLNNQMSNLWIQTKTTSQAVTQASPSGTDLEDKYALCMKIEKASDNSYNMIFGYHNTDTDDFEPKVTGVEKEVEGAKTPTKKLPKIIKLKYDSIDSSYEKFYETEADGTVKSVLIQFNKADGSVKYGAGTYSLLYKNKVVVTMYLDNVTGKHYIK